MKNIILVVLILSDFLYSQSNFSSKASKIFFLNKKFGAIIKSNNKIAVTLDGAKTWKETTIETDEKLGKVLFTSESKGWIIGEESIFNTVDSGKTWQTNHKFTGGFLNSIYFINDEYGFAGGDSIYLTHNSGQEWLNSDIDSIYYYYPINVRNFSFINDSIGIAIGSSTIFKTQNGGISWQRLPIYVYVNSGDISSGKMLDKGNIILTENSYSDGKVGSLSLSTDGGTSWNYYGNNYFDWGIDDNYIFNKDSIWLITVSNTVYATLNGGINWDTLNIRLNSFSFFSNHQAYGLGDKYLYYSDDGWYSYNVIDSTIVSINEKNETSKTPQSIILYQNYPNPFNPNTTIEFNIKEAAKVNLKIYDALGNYITTLLDDYESAGIHKVEFKVNNLSSGVYFYQIISGNYIATKKLLFLK